jgi:hypothetical protein
MVELTDTLHGWTKSVYSFGCAFIHLSNLHDYEARDPLDQIAEEEREAIIRHLRYYNGEPNSPCTRFADIVPFLPMVFTKIAGNLECCVKDLERGGDTERETV